MNQGQKRYPAFSYDSFMNSPILMLSKTQRHTNDESNSLSNVSDVSSSLSGVSEKDNKDMNEGQEESVSDLNLVNKSLGNIMMNMSMSDEYDSSSGCPVLLNLHATNFAGY